MSHRSEALSALDDIERGASSLRARLGELQVLQADQVERAAALVAIPLSLDPPMSWVTLARLA